jgi:amidohydrolase
MHVTCALAATATLLSSRSLWTGTLITLFQPAEERGTGARAMLASGLFTSHACPTPSIILGQHVFPFLSGTVHTRSGATMSAADSFKITIHGKGGHGSMPHRTIDPVVIAAHIVVRLQSIVAREVPPDETAVVTVGAINAGETENIISDRAVLKVDVRSVSEEWRGRILESIKRVVDAECVIGRCPKGAEVERTRTFPLLVNDKEATSTLEEAFGGYFGENHHGDMRAVLASEDFGELATAVGAKNVFWFWGGVDPEEWERREKEGSLDEIPVNHSPFFAPCMQPTLRTGTDALVVAALTFLGKGGE